MHGPRSLIDAERLRLRERLTLDGDFSFDALSPDGRTMYLIHYPQPRDPTAYEVRAYDLRRGGLLPDPIVDPDEPGEEMAGWPQTRSLSPDGRWAYTLYLPAERDHLPFIHALDTERGTAVCIDLDALAEFRNFVGLSLRPSPDGSVLTVARGGRALADVDLSSFEVSERRRGAGRVGGRQRRRAALGADRRWRGAADLCGGARRTPAATRAAGDGRARPAGRARAGWR